MWGDGKFNGQNLYSDKDDLDSAYKKITGKKEAGGFYKKWKSVMIPKPIYTVEQAERLLKAIT